MRSRRYGPELLALAIAVLSCGGRETTVGCEPTLTCTLRDRQFEPQDNDDAGIDRCRDEDERCRAAQVAAGGRHACASALAGELLCWGDNSEGQLGAEIRDAGIEPVDAAAGDAGIRTALLHVQRFAVGGAHTCALTRGAVLYCWGRNAEGQLNGEPSEQPERVPVAVEVEAPTAVTAGGSHTCVLAKGGVWCWGDTRYGQCGREVSDAAALPELVPDTQDAIEIAAGARHSCARFRDGHVACWGELVAEDDAEPVASAELRAVPELDRVVEIAAGAGHSCALRDDGRVWCWGLNSSGQLGDGTTTSRAAPMQVQALERSLHVSAGGELLEGELIGHSCAQTKSFHAQCWGRNQEGQLGIGVAPDSSLATVVLNEVDEDEQAVYLDEVTSVAAGGRFSCILDHDGPVRCWGDNSSGQLGLLHPGAAIFGRPTGVHRFSRPR